MRIIISILLSLTTAVIVFRLPFASRAVGLQPTISITNGTSSLEVVSTEIQANNITVKVKNIGTKPILYYQIQYSEDSPGMGVEKGLGEVLQPGEISAVTISLSDANPKKNNVVRLNLALCMFEDFSAEGDRKLAKDEREKNEGKVIAFLAMQRQTTFLVNVATFHVATFQSISNSLTELAVPKGLTEMQAIGFQQGIRDAQRLIANAVREVSQGSSEAGSEYFKKTIAQFDGAVERFKRARRDQRYTDLRALEQGRTPISQLPDGGIWDAIQDAANRPNGRMFQSLISLSPKPPTDAEITTALMKARENLVCNSDLILRCTVKSVQSYATPDDLAIYSVYEIQSTSVVRMKDRSNLFAYPLEVTGAGGTVQINGKMVGYRANPRTELMPDTHYLLFLRHDPILNDYRLISSAGIYYVRDGKVRRADLVDDAVPGTLVGLLTEIESIDCIR